jgi:signal transduction histidine kinase
MPRRRRGDYRRPVRRADCEDVAVAAAVTTLGQIDVWAPDVFSTSLVGPRWFVAVCYALAGLALAWRRRRPFATFCVVVGVLTAEAAVVGASEGNGVLVPAAVAAYSVAANASRQPAFAALALLAPVIVIRELRNPDNASLPDTANALAWNLVIVAAWLLGAYLRTRRLYVAELAHRAAHAEQERETRAVAAAVEERGRIAREMHDILAHSVSVMVVQAEAAEEMLDRDPARARLPMQKIQRTGREALVDLRRTLGILRDPPASGLAPQPGIAAVPVLAAEVEAAGLPVVVTIEGERGSLPPGLDLAAYRIVQEALTNSLKHARAQRATVTVRYTPTALHLEVCDDGRAPAGAHPDGTGQGLVGMRERALHYGGELHAGPEAAGGYLVRANLPRDSTR